MQPQNTSIIGRQTEREILSKLHRSKEAQFLSVYGRRRVGKTHLIRECFGQSLLYLEVTGIKDGSTHDQLSVFTDKFAQAFYQGAPIAAFDNWKKAFTLFTDQIEKLPTSQPVVLFLDELPWLATPRSMLMQMLDHFWNTRWSLMKNFRLIVCGSAASWMLDKLINAKGGLHNRITKSMLLEPFSLKETYDFLRALGIRLSHKHVLDLYMVTGGVPYYLKQIEKGKSVAENINQMCFTSEGLLNKEFERLFKALFEHADLNLSIVRAIASRRYGMSRQSLIEALKLTSGGTLNKRMNELEAAGFIKKYTPYGYSARQTYYRVIDEYSLFYLKWIEPGNKSGHGFAPAHWQSMCKSSSWSSWAGYSFETVCLKHIHAIMKALHLIGTPCKLGSWKYIPKKGSNEEGAQIDLLFDREDNAMTICEIKYANQAYTLDKSAAKSLVHKLDVFEKHSKQPKQMILAMITTFGVKQNVWSEDLVDLAVTLDDLFEGWC